MRASNQLAPDATLLKLYIDGQIGKICAVTKVGNGSRNPNQQSIYTSSNDDVGVLKHARERFWLANRPSLGQRRTLEHVEKLVDCQTRFNLIGKVDHSSLGILQAVYPLVGRHDFAEQHLLSAKNRTV